MKLESDRISRYLQYQKKVNDYVSKIRTNNREAKFKLAEIVFLGASVEGKLRALLESIDAKTDK